MTRSVKRKSDRIIKASKPLECPDCDGVLRLRNRRGRFFYVCTNAPRCECVHAAHSDGRPTGIPGDRETRLARQYAHDLFNQLWKGESPPMSRSEAYEWLAAAMELPAKLAHIGRFDASACRKAVKLVRDYLAVAVAACVVLMVGCRSQPYVAAHAEYRAKPTTPEAGEMFAGVTIELR